MAKVCSGSSSGHGWYTFTPGLPRSSRADGYGCSLAVIRVDVGMYRMVGPQRCFGEVLAFAPSRLTSAVRLARVRS